MEKRPHNGAALHVGLAHQGVEIGQQGVSGLQHTSGHILEGCIPGDRVLSLSRMRKKFKASPIHLSNSISFKTIRTAYHTTQESYTKEKYTGVF